ncbi:MAG TPA: transglutaminase-like domain-containing protein [Thermotogota bacterium]|nr:transglutaminase-like domain-containing protein [Thermotogota bacterium]HPH11403.1 transglutaminase-like domain-containing protein [Thermotogota bacterium]HPM21743.1 transglutaminase-like domain-containing protein [Thermotogota bacterium]HQQ66271.1 transglutaminase-like domain-containing protein [Thermotogota bacterium]
MEFLALPLPETIAALETQYQWDEALRSIRFWLQKELDRTLRRRLEYEIYRVTRLQKSYVYEEKTAFTMLAEAITDFSKEEFEKLIREKVLDHIHKEDGRYFEKRFVPNLFFAFPAYLSRKRTMDENREKAKRHLESRLDALLKGEKPRRYRVVGRIRKWLSASALETLGTRPGALHCWLPFPMEDLQQSNPMLLSVSGPEYTLSHRFSETRTVYMATERPKTTDFSVQFSYEISEIVNEVDPSAVARLRAPMDTYLREEPPHIMYTPYLKTLSREIIGTEMNPYKKAKKIYDWITKNVFYSFMREYRTYENLSLYGALNRKGDCGVQALLFITLCRMNGIPARWQSGWYANPIEPGNHDWAFFYVDPYGWLPVDCSFGGARRENEPYRNFYFANLDAFRMVACKNHTALPEPQPKYLRNDPFDNQTGEIQTDERALEPEEVESKLEILSFEPIVDL